MQPTVPTRKERIRSILADVLNESMPIGPLQRLMLDYAGTDILLAVGGLGSSDYDQTVQVMSFDLVRQRFDKRSETKMPFGRIGRHALVLDDDRRILVIGGRTTDDHYDERQRTTAFQLDVADGGDVGCQILPVDRHAGLQTWLKAQESVVNAGGTNFQDDRKNYCYLNADQSPSVSRYDFRCGSIVSVNLPEMHAFYDSPMAAADGSILFIFCKRSKRLFRVDFGESVCTILPPPPVPMYSAGICLLPDRTADRLILSDGHRVDVFDIQTQSWSTLISDTGAPTRHGAYGDLHSGPIVFDSDIIVFGFDKLFSDDRTTFSKRFDLTTGRSKPIAADSCVLPAAFSAFLVYSLF